MLSESLNRLWNALSENVYAVCYYRDESHGHAHMKSVAEKSIMIAEELGIKDEDLLRLIMITAWLHDIADHKYESESLVNFPGKTLKMILHEILEKIARENEIEIIEKIIDNLSYSKENSLRMRKSVQEIEKEWENSLGDDGYIVRTVVSDADKIEALGTIGIERCIMFTIESMYLKGIVPTVDLVTHNVIKHSHEKLLRLYPENFIKSHPGRKIAEKLHNEMKEFIDNDKKIKDIIASILYK